MNIFLQKPNVQVKRDLSFKFLIRISPTLYLYYIPHSWKSQGKLLIKANF